MADVQAGSAYIPIRPDLRGFHETIRTELQRTLGPIISRIGRELGRDLGDGLGDGLGDPLDGPMEDSRRRQRQRAPRDGDSIAGAFADGFQRKLKSAFQRLPKAEINAESTEAEAKVQTLRNSLEELSSQRIGVDVDAATALARLADIRGELEQLQRADDSPIDIRLNAGAALSQIGAFQAELDRLDGRNADIDVDADTGGAQAGLGLVGAEVSALDGRTANIGVDIDLGAAIAQLFTFRAAMLGLQVASGPALLGIGAGILGLAGPLAGAAAGFGALGAVAIPALTKIKTALDAQDKAQQSAGASAVQGQQQALALAGAEQQLADAIRAGAAAHVQALDQVRIAQQQETQAKIAAADAERALATARRDAVRAAQDLRNQVASAGLAVESDRLQVIEARSAWEQMAAAAKVAADQVAAAKTQLATAQASLAKVTADPASTEAAKSAAKANVDAAQAAVTAAAAAQKAQDLAAAKAELAYRQAVQRLKEQQLQLQRLKADEAAAAKAGVEGSDQVRAARQKLAQANLQVQNTERALAAARAGVAAADRQAAQQIAAAHRGVTSAALSAAAANATLNDSLAALSPMEAKLASAWQGLTKEFQAWALALEPEVLPLFMQGIDLLRGVLPLLTPLVHAAAGAVGDFLTQVGVAAKSPFWTQFVGFLGQITGPAIRGFGELFLSLAKSAAGLVQAFAPIGFIFLDVLNQVAGAFAQFASGLASDPSWKAFLHQLLTLSPLFVQTALSLGKLLGSVLQAIAPLIGPALGLIKAIATSLVGAFTAAGPALATFVGTLARALVPIVLALGPIIADVVKALSPLLTGLVGYLQPVLLALAPLIGAVVRGFGQIFAAIGPLLPPIGVLIGNLGRQLLPILTPLITALAGMAAQVGGQLVTALTTALPSFIQIYQAVAGLLPALLPLIPLWTQLGLALIPLIPPLAQLIAQLAVFLVPILGVVITVLVKVASTILKIVIPIIRTFVGVLGAEFKIAGVYFQVLGGLFNVLWGVAKYVFSQMGSHIHAVWANVIRPVFSALGTAISAAGTAFGRGASAIKSAWDRIRQYTKDPVNFVIGTVYNTGIRGLWNTVMKWLHLPGNLQLGKISLLESGGTLANPAAAGPMVTRGPMAIVGEGNAAWPEYVIPTDPKYRGRAQNLWASAGGHLQMLEGGGILGGILGGVEKLAGKVLNLGKDALGLLANPKGIWDKLAGPVLASSQSVATSPFGHAPAALGPKILGEAWTVAKQIISSFAGGFGGSGDGAKALAFAVAQLGKRYVWGATGPNTFDCSGLTMRAWEHAGKDIGRVTGQQVHAGRAGSRDKALRGDLHFPHEGHVMMFNKPRSGGAQEMIHAPHTGDVVRYAPFRGGGVVRLIATPGGSGSGGFAQGAGAAKNYARSQLGEFGWGAGQFSPLDSLWTRESNWRWNARNPGSGAYGIPQSLPASKMRSAGADYLTNALTQVRWGLGYIHGRYGTPGGAWAHSVNTGWYDDGGLLQPGLNLAMNATGKPEKVVNDSQWAVLTAAAMRGDGDHYHAHFDGLTGAMIQAQVRTGIQAEMVLAGQKDRTGRPR